MNKTKFVILSMPRSGSTALSLYLNSHPYIRCHSEVLLKSEKSADAISYFFDHVYTRRAIADNPAKGVAAIDRDSMLENYDRDALGHPDNAFTTKLLSAFLSSLFYNPGHPLPWTSLDNAGTLHRNENFDSEKAVGFKLMYYELSNASLNQWLTTEPIKIVHLVRENVLRILLSNWVAKKRNVWHTESGLDPVSVHVDPGEILPLLGELAKTQQQMENKFPAPKALRVTYEEFCHSPESLGRKVSDHLGLDADPMKMPGFERTTPMATSEVIENYDEIADTLTGTRYEQYLHQ